MSRLEELENLVKRVKELDRTLKIVKGLDFSVRKSAKRGLWSVSVSKRNLIAVGLSSEAAAQKIALYLKQAAMKLEADLQIDAEHLANPEATHEPVEQTSGAEPSEE